VQKTTLKQKANQRLDKIKEKKAQLLDTRSLPIRQYLLDKVLPTLTEGLINFTSDLEYGKMKEGEDLDVDQDVIDYIIQFLEEKGEKMEFEA